MRDCLSVVLLAVVGSGFASNNDLIGLRKIDNDILGKVYRFPDGVRWYERTQWTQSLFVLDGRDTRWIEPRSAVKWRVPGGLEGLRGWRSKLGVILPGKIVVNDRRVFVAFAPRMLPRRGWLFPDGTLFLDALYKDGELFEVRQREKVNGKWRYSVPFRDLDLAPVGYRGPGKPCQECHSRVGASEVYGPLNPGDDETFSFDDDGRLLGLFEGGQSAVQVTESNYQPARQYQSYGRRGLLGRRR